MENFSNLAALSSGRNRSYFPDYLRKFLKRGAERNIANIRPPGPQIFSARLTLMANRHSKASKFDASERFLSVGQVCKMLSASRSWIYEQVACGAFPAQFNLGKRRVVWRLSDILNFMESVVDGKKDAAK